MAVLVDDLLELLDSTFVLFDDRQEGVLKVLKQRDDGLRTCFVGVQNLRSLDPRQTVLGFSSHERKHPTVFAFPESPTFVRYSGSNELNSYEKDFISLILKAYKAEPITGSRCFYGKKSGRFVSIGPVNLPVTRLFVEEIILESREKRVSRVDVLAFEFEMGLFPNILDVAKSKGIDLSLKYIPRDVFDKRAVAKDQIVFNDVSYIEVKPHFKKNTVSIELIDFAVFYNQDTLAN